MFCAEILERTFTSFQIFNYLRKEVTFLLITKFKTNMFLSYLSVN